MWFIRIAHLSFLFIHLELKQLSASRQCKVWSVSTCAVWWSHAQILIMFTLALGIILRFTPVLFRSSNSEGRGFDSQWWLSWSNDSRCSIQLQWLSLVSCCIIKCVKGWGWVCLYGVNTRLCWCCSQNRVSVPVLQNDSDIRLNSLSLSLSFSNILVLRQTHSSPPPSSRPLAD